MLTALSLQTTQPTAGPTLAYFTLVAALVAATASIYSTVTASKTARDAANTAAKSAMELKNKEFKNDYYKKVLEKRMSAIERIDALSALFRTIKKVSDSEAYYSVFLEDNYDDIYTGYLNDVFKVSFWVGVETYNAVKEFNIEVQNVMRDYKKIPILDKAARKDFIIKNFKRIEAKRLNISKILIVDLKDLENIESFLKKREDQLGSLRD